MTHPAAAPAAATVVRFAPSPTGLLHVGNARTALLNGLFALATGGRFILRFDDTDAGRSRVEYADATEADLRWLGLDWAERNRQSQRLDRYGRVFAELRAAGRVYPCYETPEELEFKRRRQRARDLPPIYDRHALSLSAADRRTLEAAGRQPHWRFRLDDEATGWQDVVRGPVQFQAQHLSDPVVVRADGTFLYLLPSVIDDMDLGITHVIRGEDHVPNTPAQIQMCRAIGGTPPAFAHVPLMTDIAGRGLSKRLGSLTLRALADDGIEPMALAAYLASLGTGEPLAAAPSLAVLARDFDLCRYGRGTPKFDLAQLQAANQRLLHDLPLAAVAPRLRALGLGGADAAFWEAVRPNLSRLADARRWHDVCFGAIEPVIVDAAFIGQAAAALPAEPWNAATWAAWTRAVGTVTGRRGRDLYQPLRLALTGLAHGPELKALLPLIGRARALDRLGRPAMAEAAVAVGADESGR
jgi:glutamyl-tRNA synthetase